MHPDTLSELGRQRRHEDLGFAEHDRLVREAREAREGRAHGAIDAVPSRDRLSRLLHLGSRRAAVDPRTAVDSRTAVDPPPKGARPLSVPIGSTAAADER